MKVSVHLGHVPVNSSVGTEEINDLPVGIRSSEVCYLPQARFCIAH